MMILCESLCFRSNSTRVTGRCQHVGHSTSGNVFDTTHLHTNITYLLNSQEESSSSNSICLKVEEFSLLGKHFQFSNQPVCLNCNWHLFETKLLSSALSFIWRKWNSKVSESQREQSLWFGSGSQIYCSCMRAILSFHCQVSATFPAHYAPCLSKK